MVLKGRIVIESIPSLVSESFLEKNVNPREMMAAVNN